MVAKVTVGSRQRRLATPPGLPPDHVAGCPLDLFLAPNPAKSSTIVFLPLPLSLPPAPVPVPVPVPVPAPVPAPVAAFPNNYTQTLIQGLTKWPDS